MHLMVETSNPSSSECLFRDSLSWCPSILLILSKWISDVNNFFLFSDLTPLEQPFLKKEEERMNTETNSLENKKMAEIPSTSHSSSCESTRSHEFSQMKSRNEEFGQTLSEAERSFSGLHVSQRSKRSIHSDDSSKFLILQLIILFLILILFFL